MAFGKTYLAGASGLFRVFNHSTDSWNDYSGFTSLDLYDVKTSQLPISPNYAIIAGDTYLGYTTNGGATVTSVTCPIGKAFQISIPESVNLNNPGVYIAGSGLGSLPGVIKSVDGGLTYTSITTGLGTGFSSVARSIYFSDVNTGILGQGGAIAKTTNGGASWSYLNGGAILALGEIVSGLYMSDDQSTIIATTARSIWKSTNSGASFTSVYTWSNPFFYGAAPKYSHLAWYSNNHFWVSAGNGAILYSGDFGSTWSEVYPAASLGADSRTLFGCSFYSPTEGFFTYDLPADGDGLVYRVTNANTSMILTTSNDYYPSGDIPGYALWSTQVTEGCGCPPGFTLNPSSNLCVQSTNLCPEGFQYNPDTNDCEGADTPCELDLVIAIDRSSSISTAEMVSYKTFISEIIDAVEDQASGEDRITTDKVRVGIVYWGSASPLINAESGSGTNLNLQIGNTSIWQPGIGNGILKARINTMAALGPANGTYGGQGTNYFAGLKAAYEVVTGANSRPGAQKRILWITDGWPNTSNPPVTINGVSQPINVLDSGCTSPSVAGVNTYTAPLNICHAASDLAGNPNTSSYTIAKRSMYTQAMDLAQAIKNGSGSNTTVEVAITAIIVGNQNERATTKGALVGTNPTGTGATDYCQFNVNTWAIAEGLTTAINCRYWDASYQVTDGGGNWLRFPSNNAAGTPDYFETNFVYDASIIAGIKTSLLCTITEPTIACPPPCVINTVTNKCDCVSSDPLVPCCYTLTNCNTGIPEYTVNTYGLSNDYLNSLEGKVIKVTGLDECLYVNLSFECTNSTEISIDAVEETFETCEQCKEFIETPPCYLLTNCNNSDITLLSVQDLSTYSGKVIELNGYPGLCWTVLKTINCPGPFTTVNVAQSYSDCECCFQYQCNN